MSRALEWIFKLHDKISGPALRIDRSLERVDDALGNVNRSGASNARVMNAMAGRSASWSRQLHGMFEAAFPVVSVLRDLGGAAVAVGQAMAGAIQSGGAFVLDAVAFKENSLTALETILGTKEAAHRALQQGIEFASTTPFSTRQIQEAYANLFTARFSEVEVPIVLRGVGDLAALKGFDPQVIDRVISTFGKIKAKGQLGGEEVGSLAEVGVPMLAIYEKLSKVMGVSVDQVRKLQSAGKIDADTGIYAVLDAIRTSVSGGKLGQLMERQSQTLTGLWSTLQSRPFELVMNLDTHPAIAGIKEVLGGMNGLLSPATETGQKIEKAFGSAFGRIGSALLGDLVGSDSTKNLDRLIDRGLIWLDLFVGGAEVMISLGRTVGGGLMEIVESLSEGLGPMEEYGLLGGMVSDSLGMILAITSRLAKGLGVLFRNLWPLLIAFAMVFAVVKGVALVTLAIAAWPITLAIAIGAGILLIASYWDEISAVFSGAWEWASTIGTQVWQGMRDGILGGGAAIAEASGVLADLAIGSLKGLLGIASPSKVFRQMGGYTAEGFTLGLEDGNQQVNRAMDRLATPPQVSPAYRHLVAPPQGQARTGSAGGHTFNLTLHMGGQAPTSREDMLQMFQETVETMFENVALQLGVCNGSALLGRRSRRLGYPAFSWPTDARSGNNSRFGGVTF